MSLQNMRKDVFVILSKKGCIGRGTFPYHTWHKEEKENIMRAVGVKCEYGEPVFKGEDRGIYKTVGDREHADIIKLYLNDDLGMSKIAEKLGRSSASVHSHIKRHNRAVRRSGFCAPCRRVKASFESDLAER